MKKLLFALIVLITTSSCSNQEDVITSPKEIETFVPANDQEFLISFQDSVDGRATYTVFFSDGKALENLYAEEICNMLVSNKMDSTIYNENLVLTEYQ